VVGIAGDRVVGEIAGKDRDVAAGAAAEAVSAAAAGDQVVAGVA